LLIYCRRPGGSNFSSQKQKTCVQSVHSTPYFKRVIRSLNSVPLKRANPFTQLRTIKIWNDAISIGLIIRNVNWTTIKINLTTTKLACKLTFALSSRVCEGGGIDHPRVVPAARPKLLVDTGSGERQRRQGPFGSGDIRHHQRFARGVSNCRRALRWSVLPRARSRLLQCCERILDPLNRVPEK
jgi:hypothetical protein